MPRPDPRHRRRTHGADTLLSGALEPAARPTATTGWGPLLAYRATDSLTLWAGYNYARNSIPNRHLNPLLVTIAQHHLTGGLGWQASERIRLGVGLEWQLPNEVSDENPKLPFGPDVRARAEYIAVPLGFELRL